jgi:hypothetical protein
MSRLFISAKHAPSIAVQFTKDVADVIKPHMIELFGIKFLQSESESDDGKTLMYDFEADEDEVSNLLLLFKKIYDESIVKDIDINLSLN